MVNFGPGVAEIDLPVWGTPSNCNGLRMLASLLQRRRSTEVNKTLHNAWLSFRLIHYIYIFGGSCSLTEFCKVQNSLCVQVLRPPILAALLHGTRVVGISQTLRRCADGPSIFGRAAITLGISPHSSSHLLLAALQDRKSRHRARDATVDR